jgi:hypothetical protein
MARRVLERLGAKLDRKLESQVSGALGHRAVGDLATRVEQAVSNPNLLADQNGLKRVAANRLEVLLTYEESSDVNDQYLEALSGELTSAAENTYRTGDTKLPGPFDSRSAAICLSNLSQSRPHSIPNPRQSQRK